VLKMEIEKEIEPLWIEDEKNKNKKEKENENDFIVFICPINDTINLKIKRDDLKNYKLNYFRSFSNFNHESKQIVLQVNEQIFYENEQGNYQIASNKTWDFLFQLFQKYQNALVVND